MTFVRLLPLTSLTLLAACTILINGQPLEYYPHSVRTTSTPRVNECKGVHMEQPGAPEVPDNRMGDNDYVVQVLANKIKEQKLYIDGLLNGTICPDKR